MTRTRPLLPLLAALILCAHASAADSEPDTAQPDHPTIFADLSPADAGRRADRESKLLLIKATAEWCGPCKHMDRTTFRDQRVIDWINQNAVAVELDVDEMPGGAKALRINAMPTIILFRHKTELDRVVGYQSADDLLAFLKDAAAGKTHDQRVAEDLADLEEKADDGDMDARYDYAEALLRERRYDKATDEYEWLWNNILDHAPSYVGVRSSFMASEMERLADAHPPARRRFAELRGELEPRIQPGDDFDADALSDWIVLNEVVGDEQRTHDWIDRIAQRDDARRYLQGQHRIFDILTARGDWALAGDSLPHVAILTMRYTRTDFDTEPFNTPHFRSYTVNACADNYAALLAAGRTDDARRLAQSLLDIDAFDNKTTRDTLAARAADAGIPEPDRRTWQPKSP